MITKIHQTSKTKQLNEFQQECSDNIRMFHPKSEYKLWDDEDIKNLAKKEFPELLDIWKDLQGIQRADIGRYIILYVEGGMYADTDIIFKNNFFDNMDIDKNKIYFAPSVRLFPWSKNTMTNYLIYAPQERLEFFNELVKECIKRVKEFKNTYYLDYVPYTTGRAVVTDTADKYQNIDVFDETKILNRLCSNTEITDSNICYHEGSTIRNEQDGSWRNGTLMKIMQQECNARETLGIKGNICQAPITIIGMAILLVSLMLLFYRFYRFL